MVPVAELASLLLARRFPRAAQDLHKAEERILDRTPWGTCSELRRSVTLPYHPPVGSGSQDCNAVPETCGRAWQRQGHSKEIHVTETWKYHELVER